MSVEDAQELSEDTVVLMPVFVAKPLFRAELESALRELQERSREESGCIAYSVFSDRADPERFVLYEEWVTDEALTEHNAQEHVGRFVSTSSEWLAWPFTVARLRAIASRF